MTDALINNKPHFVRLFAENGLNILDYLTYGRLEGLYQSVADGTLLYQLLQRYLVERLGNTPFARTSSTAQDSASKVTAEDMQSGPIADISLFEVHCFFYFFFTSLLLMQKREPAVSPQVGEVLELLMGDVCQPFYYDALGLEQVASKRKALRVFFSFTICGQILITAKEPHF